MDNQNKKDEVMSKIVQMLASDGTFTEIVYAILTEAERYLETTNAAILQISQDNAAIGAVIDYGAGSGPAVSFSKMSAAQFRLGDEKLKYRTLLNCSMEERNTLEQLGVKTSVTVPIYINGIRAMYFAVFDTCACLELSPVQLQFISDVSKIIQSIAQKNVTRNSLLSSYEVLREILSSIGSGIMVCNRQDGSVFFENEIAQRTEEVRRTIRECIQEHFSENAGGQAVSGKRQGKRDMNPDDIAEGQAIQDTKPIEHYDAESGLWFEIKFSDMTWIDGSEVVVCTAMDITQKKKNQQKIEYQAHNDFLTGLYNRMKCENDLRRVIQYAQKTQKKGAVMFIDLDDFKHINDGLGHQYGDVLLQQIAAGLQGVPGLRGNCYRMGGDEFLVIVGPEQYESLQRIIKNVVAMFNKPWYLMGTEYFCTMSMGIAIFPDNSQDVHEIIKMADMAMYDAKKSGKNRYGMYDGSESRNTFKRLDIENNMRQAVATEIQEFVVFYQPVVDTFTKKCTSCEALVRWNSKALGFMGPGDFIPLAEYLGLITDIGDYVLEEACRQCKRWNENGRPDFHINVNLSVVQLLQKNVVENIGMILEQTGVNPYNIILEITESFAINDMERVLKIIEGLKALGPRIALDDFGTGYSSLNYIKQLPLNIIKVDKTFIDDIIEDEYAQAFVRLIVDLSKTIGTQIVVEGVEYEEQYEMLKSLGVNYIQGYLFGRPVPAEEFEQLHFGRQTESFNAETMK